jgi:RNA polymerase sigma-70 factor (ECF subfamily)
MRSDLKTYSDPDLAILLANGSEPAFTEIVERYWESLFTKANNFLRDEDAAKDCVQDIFISLWQNHHKTEIENLNSYLHQAVRFRALRMIRDLKASAEFETRINELTHLIINDDWLIFKELKTIVEALVESLPEDQRVIFKLHREEQLTYRQIAEKMDISIKTVEKKMSKSLNHLRLGLDDAFGISLIIIILSK